MSRMLIFFDAASVMSEPLTLDLRLTDIIREIGVPPHLKGYYYLREAILMVIENDEFIRAVTTKLYPLIAERHGTTSHGVQQAILHCIAAAINRGNITLIHHIFGQGRKQRRITGKEFIVTIADLLKNEPPCSTTLVEP